MKIRIIRLFIIALIILSLSSCSSTSLSKEDIFTIVTSNEELIRESISEIHGLKKKFIFISTTLKTEISDSKISGLFQEIKLEDKKRIDVKLDNAVIEKVINIKGIEMISTEGSIIEFECGADGFGSESSYYGFYYTEKDNPEAIWCCGGKLTKDGNGWSWKESNGDNSYYTEKICEDFYFYLGHY